MFFLAVPMRECFRKHSCMSSPFPIAIVNGTLFFLSLVQEKRNMPSGHYYRYCFWSKKVVFYGQTCASRWGIYYHRMWDQLWTTCSNILKSPKWGTPCCSRPQPATDNGVRDCESNCLVAPPTLMGRTPWAPRIERCKRGLEIAGLAAETGARTRVHGYARPTHCRSGHGKVAVQTIKLKTIFYKTE